MIIQNSQRNVGGDPRAQAQGIEPATRDQTLSLISRLEAKSSDLVKRLNQLHSSLADVPLSPHGEDPGKLRNTGINGRLEVIEYVLENCHQIATNLSTFLGVEV